MGPVWQPALSFNLAIRETKEKERKVAGGSVEFAFARCSLLLGFGWIPWLFEGVTQLRVSHPVPGKAHGLGRDHAP